MGKTWKRGGLLSRLNDFEKSANSGRKAHHGGQNYHQEFSEIQSNLYVSVYSMESDEPEVTRNAFIMYVERKLIWEFTVAHNRRPICNRE